MGDECFKVVGWRGGISRKWRWCLIWWWYWEIGFDIDIMLFCRFDEGLRVRFLCLRLVMVLIRRFVIFFFLVIRSFLFIIFLSLSFCLCILVSMLFLLFMVWVVRRGLRLLLGLRFWVLSECFFDFVFFDVLWIGIDIFLVL